MKRTGADPEELADSAIDFSDIPELSQEQLRGMRRVGRPPVGGATKVAIAFRVHPDLLARLRLMAAQRRMPYQTLMHEMLEREAFGTPSGGARKGRK